MFRLIKNGEELIFYGRFENTNPNDYTFYQWNCRLGTGERDPFIDVEAKPKMEPLVFAYRLILDIFNPEGYGAEFRSETAAAAHSSFDLIGFIPVFGDVTDFANAGLYILEGEFKEAGISVICAVLPLVGDFLFKGTRLYKKASHIKQSLEGDDYYKVKSIYRRPCTIGFTSGGIPEFSPYLLSSHFLPLNFNDCDGPEHLIERVKKVAEIGKGQLGFKEEQMDLLTTFLMPDADDNTKLLEFLNNQNDQHIYRFLKVWDASYKRLNQNIQSSSEIFGIQKPFLEFITAPERLDDHLEAFAKYPDLFKSWKLATDLGFDEAKKVELFADLIRLAPDEELVEAFAGQPELVRAWEVLSSTSIRTSTYWLGRISRWQDVGLNFTFVQHGTKVKVFREADEVAEIDDELQYFKINFNGLGGDIYCPLDRTVTVIGKFHSNVPKQGTWYLLPDLKLFKMGNNPGGINLLNIPVGFTWEKNRIWLTEATQRGDLIRIISDPADNHTIWKNGINTGNWADRTWTGKEIYELENVLDYHFDPSISAYIPNQ